uniref:Tyr recombinase domain-containing protein n=1 Tax=Strongyloides papillosus TaxID=174720 RepID=A0A0N5C6W3_STREA
MEDKTNIQESLQDEEVDDIVEVPIEGVESIISNKEMDVAGSTSKSYSTKFSLEKINKDLTDFGISEQARECFWKGYRSNSVKCIESTLRHWEEFTLQKEYFKFSDVCEFIMYLKERLGTTSVKTYSNYFLMILTLNDVILDKKEKEIIKKMVKGIVDDTIVINDFRTTWSVERAIENLKTVVISQDDSNAHIASKLAILILLKYPFRMHELHSIIRENVKIEGDAIFISLPVATKTMSPGTTIKIIDYNDDNLKIAAYYHLYCLKTYPRQVLKKGKRVTSLWLKQDGEQVHQLTLHNWVRKILALIGVDDNLHSVRSATVAGKIEKRVPIDKILEWGRWRSEDTLRQYYMKSTNEEQ